MKTVVLPEAAAVFFRRGSFCLQLLCLIRINYRGVDLCRSVTECFKAKKRTTKDYLLVAGVHDNAVDHVYV